MMRRGVLQEHKSISVDRASELKALEAECSPETETGNLTASADIGASAQQAGKHLCIVGLIVPDSTVTVLIIAAEDNAEDLTHQAFQEEPAATNQLPFMALEESNVTAEGSRSDGTAEDSQARCDLLIRH
jgi:hypothetical protein